MKDNYAFPHVTPMGEKAPGMELRDWFAGMAMQALVSNYEAAINEASIKKYTFSDVAECAYNIANIMMAERESNG